MAETSAFPEHDPSSQAPDPLAATEAEIDAAASDGPAQLEAMLAAALDEDDLPEPHPPAPTPTLEAATARPFVGSYGAPDAEAPTVATTLEVPPLARQVTEISGTEGGEWELLLAKFKAWLEQVDLPGQWERLGGPLRGVGLLLAVLLVIKLYLALLDTLDDLPLLPRLLQLVGLLAFFNFALTRFTRSSDRRVILEDWKRRWDAFRGS